MSKKWYRNKADGILSGVCQGLGECWGISPWILRLAFVVPALPFVLNTTATVLSVGTYIVLTFLLKDKKKLPGGKPEVVDADFKIVGDDQEDDS